ncbi:3'(2'),5'-bisphosphate nucleotidase CysQ family protein [Legionella hackeliae]|uniref:Putative 3'(2'),5'-bisphosphate nucleotidase n=1 Tax=Legionella hackeliae TaxID=449 RepID=A0A0A8UU07_LEGHA|nr:3'(2'),5'-bisphosphate nucleotidase CysQ [Legionella hackeliae]KTD09672.1 inositol monophosphatase [Legionella hackeliae]CEK11011.1 putative 3'(2'),5'-bisphosphate nucleotidase [Legionella hackeliae]STX47753.1 inositol monophosphatase [Legionella hackeliae]
MNQLDKDLEFVINLARQAGSLVQTVRKSGYKIYDKGMHLGLVTDADKAASQFLVSELSRAFPNDLVISEEESIPSENYPTDRVWFIDPIDGTADFIAGSSEWSVMIGLAINKTARLGVVYQPDSNELYYAIRKRGAFYSNSKDTVKLKVRHLSDPSQAILIQSRMHWSIKADKIAKQLEINQIFKCGSLGLKLGKIAKKEADLYFNFSGHCHLWDLCGPEVILKEAGGTLLFAGINKLYYEVGETRVKYNFLAAPNKLATKVYSILEQEI